MTSEDTATTHPVVSVVVLAYGREPLLGDCVKALLASQEVDVQVVLVDNGCTTDAVERLRGRPGIELVEPGSNTGFAGGCNLGAQHSTGSYVAFVNSDVVVDARALAELVRALEDPGVGVASGSLRLLDRPDVMNSAGNPVHYLGLSWAGGLGEPAAHHTEGGPVASATGAVMALRREDWDQLGGFYEPMFAYCEDAELSLRCWLSGRQVLFVPAAVALHGYEFSRNSQKNYLLERNRLLLLLTVYQVRTLWLLALPIVALEVAIVAMAARQGWARKKVEGWWWLVRHRRQIVRRRHAVQSARRHSDARLVPLLAADFSPGAESGMASVPVLSSMSRLYWRLVSRWIG